MASGLKKLHWWAKVGRCVRIVVDVKVRVASGFQICPAVEVRKSGSRSKRQHALVRRVKAVGESLEWDACPSRSKKSNFTLETEVKEKATGDQVEVEMRVRVDHFSGAFERFVVDVSPRAVWQARQVTSDKCPPYRAVRGGWVPPGGRPRPSTSWW